MVGETATETHENLHAEAEELFRAAAGAAADPSVWTKKAEGADALASAVARHFSPVAPLGIQPR